MTIPEGYENELSQFGPCIFDGYCGEPIGWGFKINRRLGEERFNMLRKYGALECVGGYNSSWVLVTKWLTREEAIQEYGAVSEEEYGPRGGWKSVTFGEKKFISKHLKGEKKI